DMLLSILNDILDYSKIESGDLNVLKRQFALREEFYSIAAEMRRRASAKGLAFSMDLDDAMPWSVIGDPRHLRRILLNLLGNAVKFTDKGRVKFGVVWVARDKDGATGVKFVVTDTGPGITPEVARNLFNPFQQGDSSNTRKHGGLGLGLTIANRLALQLGGRLTFETKEDSGTTFTFFLPTREIDERAVRTFQPRDRE
ncbi:MAG TPA: ATP-binding protein, partial [Opitutales bacterium]|nr:ATP-binding protein [Opitutales bacterium]